MLRQTIIIIKIEWWGYWCCGCRNGYGIRWSVDCIRQKLFWVSSLSRWILYLCPEEAKEDLHNISKIWNLIFPQVNSIITSSTLTHLFISNVTSISKIENDANTIKWFKSIHSVPPPKETKNIPPKNKNSQKPIGRRPPMACGGIFSSSLLSYRSCWLPPHTKHYLIRTDCLIAPLEAPLIML